MSFLQSNERRRFLQSLCQDTNNIGNKTSNPHEMIKETKNVLLQANHLYHDGDCKEMFQNPRDNYLDSQVMKATSEVVVQCSQAISSEMNKYEKFKLAENITHNSDFWCFAFPNEAPPVTYIHGASADAPTRPRSPRMRRPRAQQQQATITRVPRTDNIGTENDEETKKTTMMLEKLESVCRDEPISYFHAVLHPTNFARSVENIYHLAFMVRDGNLSVFIDEETKLPFIRTLSKHKRRRLENSTEKQFIVSICMAKWKELVEVLKIKEIFFKTPEDED
ncbi:unnamed protein product [Euphydryas editha]|uniref:Non-structural maintenance of chromosomes element 4 n=1 Tax=Euphydryas editha TaxID=104508 RepID=A0AAU9UPR6_EUPED|nr:unnamed protein product [Euphydryas editha]